MISGGGTFMLTLISGGGLRLSATGGGDGVVAIDDEFDDVDKARFAAAVWMTSDGGGLKFGWYGL